MDRRRGFMKKEKVFRILDEIAAKRSWLGPLYPVKLHQMGEPMLHPELPAIVEYAESRGVPIELNTNCGLITPENIDALYRAGLTNLILSYQTPDVASFKTRKAPRISFEDYRDKVRLAVERKVALGARTRIEIDIMNTKYADGYRIVSEDEQAVAFIEDWVAFCEELERRYGLAAAQPRPRAHPRLPLPRPGRERQPLRAARRRAPWSGSAATRGATSSTPPARPAPSTPAASCMPCRRRRRATPTARPPTTSSSSSGTATWSSCCTDYEGRTKTANVFASSIEEIWKGETLTQRKQDMLEGRLLDVCSKCMGLG